MKTITKFIFGLPMFALASGSIAFAQVPPVTPADSAAKAAAQGAAPAGAVDETVAFASGSRWHLTVNAVDKFGLVITGASFQKSPRDPFIYVLFDGRLGEIFVPYHSGHPRYKDIEQYEWKNLTLPQAQFPLPRQIIGGGKICKEVRNYLAWITAPRQVDFNDNSTRIRYGQEVVYFSVLRAGNYDYIMEWTFRDDGAILVRAGSTGPKIDAGSETTEGHMHNFTWRLDIDLNGASNNSAYLTSHEEDLMAPPCSWNAMGCSTAEDNMNLISVEGSRFWRPQNFNTLQIRDKTLKNGNGHTTSYELVPMRSGTARHTEAFTRKDFWVSRYDPAQSLLAGNLPEYVRDSQPTVDQDLVIWYTGSEHHEKNSRDEDDITVPVLWTGFQLIPNNLFDHTPFYPNP